MPASSSIASEFYKLQEMWTEAVRDLRWRLAVWTVKDEDIILIDKFLEIEQSPAGVFDDIFFRFGSPWEGDAESFNVDLWREYAGWFEETPPEKYDIYGAMKKDGILLTDYSPDLSTDKTPANLWKEMLRFKSCIKDLEDSHFCVCLPVARYDSPDMTEWFKDVLAEGVPAGIRLIAVDTVADRKVKLKPSEKVVILSPQLNMREALDNDMDKNSGSYDPVNPGNRYEKQLRLTMECAAKNKDTRLTKEVNKLYSCAAELQRSDIDMATPLIASQAYYMAGCYGQSLYHAEKSVSMSREGMDDPAARTVWMAAMYQKGAVLSGQQRRAEAIAVYEEVADEATLRREPLHIMEAYRMSGYLYYELGQNEDALDRFLLSLYVGGYLDEETRRQSTFLYSAALALHLSSKIRGEEDNELLTHHLREWIGDDWQELVESGRMKEAKKRKKASVFS